MDDRITITKSDYHLFLEAPFHLWKHKHGGINQTPTANGFSILTS
jgi:hypothetical protein